MKKRVWGKKWLSLAILAGLAVLIAVVWSFYGAVETRTVKQPLYSFQLDWKQDYAGVTKFSRKDGVTTVKNDGKSFEAGSTPFYYEGGQRVLLPQNMIGCLTQKPLFGRVNYFTELYAENGTFYAQNGSRTKELAQTFLFDGGDLFVFLEPVTLRWEDKEIPLPSLSYVIVRYNQSVEYYDAASGVCTVSLTGESQVIAAAQSGWKLNLSTDIFIDGENNQILLFKKPELLPDLLTS